MITAGIGRDRGTFTDESTSLTPDVDLELNEKEKLASSFNDSIINVLFIKFYLNFD